MKYAAGLALILAFAVGIGLQGDSASIGPLIVQLAGTTMGAAPTMNFSTGTSVSLSGGVATVTASGTPSEPLIVQLAGTTKGYAPTMNFSTGTSVSLSGGVATVTASGTPSSNSLIRSIGGGFDGGGSALTTGAVTYLTVPFSCTIAAFNITVDTGTISFDVWKIATGTAIPTVSNSILTGGYLAISTGTALHSASTALFTTTTVSANDVFGIEIEAVSSATKASLVLQCNAT